MDKNLHPTFLQTVLQASRKVFMYVGVFSFFQNMLVLTLPLYMMQVFDSVLVSHSYETLLYLTILAVLALGVLSFLDILRSRLLIILGHWLDSKLSPEALRRSADDLLQGNTYANQSLRDVQSLRNFLSTPSIYAVFDVPWAPVFIIIIFFLSPVLGWITVIGGLVMVCLALVNEVSTRKAIEANTLAQAQTQQHIQTTMQNSEVIQAMGMMNGIVQHWHNKNNFVMNLSTFVSNRNSLLLGISKFLRLILQIAILGAGAYLVIINKITPGAMITASILLTRAFSPIEQVIASWKLLPTAYYAYKRLNKYFADEPKRLVSSVLQEPRGVVTVEEVSYQPKGSDRFILKDISLRLEPGELLTIIGPSAAGKTTLARLLIGVWAPTKGTVRLDNADVFTWERSEFGKYVGYLPQDIELFHGTVQDNIARMHAASKEAVMLASRLTGAHDFILRLPKGYGTVLNDAGRSLSGGQRQSLALARAILNFPRFLVLDEPTTYLDKQTQDSLFQVLMEFKKRGSTVAIVSHHPALIKYADKILYLERGEILHYGRRDDVLMKLQQRAQAS